VSLLSEPFEYIDLHPGASMTIRVDKWELGSGVIHPRVVSQRHLRKHMDQRGLTEPPVAGTPISVEEPVLRLFGARVDEVSPMPYFDVSSKRLQADLLARFRAGLWLPSTIRLTANGAKPLKTYSVEIV